MPRIIDRQLMEMGFEQTHLSLVQSKNGIYVYRVFCQDKSYILKYFEDEQFCREIELYALLNRANIQTLELVAKTNNSLLLEDILQNDNWRLGVLADLKDCEVASALAAWYKTLHKNGKVVLDQCANLYSELNQITINNIELLSQKSQTQNNPVWRLLINQYPRLIALIEQAEKTLVYNDFYYTNMAVRKDKTKALMFDYNYMGSGILYSDIRNVTSSLEGAAKDAFIQAYGGFDRSQILLDEITGTIFSLLCAYNAATLPSWAQNELQKVNSGALLKQAVELLV